MLQKAKNKYGIETLKTLNVLYDREHRLIFLSRHGDYYDNALIVRTLIYKIVVTSNQE